MKISNLKKLACITAIVLAPSIAFAGDAVDVSQSSKEYTDVVVDDATLASHVESALKADPLLQELDIAANASSGVVTLTGVASATRWTAQATMVAKKVKGVKSVKNNMTIGHK